MMRISTAYVGGLITAGLLAPVALVFLLCNVTIYGTWAPIPIEVYGLFFGWYACFFAGYFLVRLPRGSGAGRPPDPNAWVPLLAIAAVVGAAMMTYNFAIVRGYGFGTPVSLLRMRQVMDADAGYVGSWVGGVGRLLLTAIIAAWIIATTSWRRLRLPSLLTLIGATLLVFLYQSFYEGGRFFIAALVISSLFGTMLWIVSEARRGSAIDLRALRLVHAGPLALLLTMAVGVTAYSSYVFTERGQHAAQRVSQSSPETMAPETQEKLNRLIPQQREQTGTTEEPRFQGETDDKERSEETSPPRGSTEEGSSDSPRQPSRYALSYINYVAMMDIDMSSFRNAEGFSAADYTRAMAWSYLTQGLSEFARLYRHPGFQHAHGFYQFSQIAQVLSLVTGRDIRYKAAEGLPEGTYVSAPGAFYLDFGVLGLLIAALLGVALRRGVDSAIFNAYSACILLSPLIMLVVVSASVSTLVPNIWPAAAWLACIEVARHVISGVGRQAKRSDRPLRNEN